MSIHGAAFPTAAFPTIDIPVDGCDNTGYMVTLNDSLVSSAKRKLPVRVRPDIRSSRSQYLGLSYWIVKDPVGSKYFRFHDEEYFILKQFDGTKSLEEIKDAFEKEFLPQKITLEELQRFLGQLHQSNLILSVLPNQGTELLKRRNKRRRQEMLQKCSNILSIKFKGFDPDRLLDALYPWVAWCFHPATVACSLLLGLAAALLILVQFDIFRSKLPAFQDFFGVSNIILLSITLGATKALHEFGHGLTAKHFGGECHEMGIMILVLTPCPYVNVSDSWMLPNKWARIAIAAAGVWVECTLAAVCTFLWWFSTPGLLNYLCLNIMFVSSVSTILFNLNPLLRYDGYYVMSDWLEIPNLRQKATKVLTNKCSEWFLGMESQEDPFLPRRNRLLFALFSVASFFYRWVVMASILFFIYKVFEPYGLQIIGKAIACMSLLSLFIMPLYKVGKFFWVPGRIYKVKKARFYLSLGGLAAIVAFVCVIPLPYTVVVPVAVELNGKTSQAVYVPQIPGGGRLVHVEHVAFPGMGVTAGTPLARLENLALEQETTSLLGQSRAIAKELDGLERLVMEKRDAALRVGPLKEQLAATLELYEAKRHLLMQLHLTAPRDGIVVSPPWRQHREPPEGELPLWSGSPLDPENRGATLEPGTIFCSVGDPKLLEGVLVADQSKIGFLMKEQRTEILLDAFPGRIFSGIIAKIEEREMNDVPTQLSTRGGGDVPTSTNADGHERPSRASYRITVPLENDDESIRVGMTGLAKVHVAPQTLGYRLWRLFNETFNFKLN